MKKILLAVIILISLEKLSFAQTVAKEYSKAMNAYQKKEYAEAGILFQKFFSGYKITDGVYATAKYYASDALMKLGEFDAAAAGFEFFVNHFSWSGFADDALYNLGLIYYKKGEYDKSRERFVQLINEYPESEHAGSAYYWVGQTYSRQNKPEDAIVFLQGAISKHPYNKYIDYSIYTLARIFEKIGDYKSAEEYYDTLLSYHANSPLATAAHIRIGICYFKLKDYNSSVLELNDPVLKDLPATVYSQSLYLLANSYYRLQEYSKAENVYLEILKNYPASSEVRDSKYGLAWAYFQQKKYNEAYRIFDNLSLGNDSLAVKSFYWKAESKRYAGQEDAAFNIYQQFLKRYPNNNLMKGVEYQLGLLYYNSKDYGLAEKYLKSSINASDNSVKARAYAVLGEMDLNNRNYTDAVNNFESAMNVQGIEESLINRSMLGLGAAYYFLHKYNDAISNLSDINFRNPDFEKDKVNFYMAETYYSMENYKDAIQRYNMVSSRSGELAAMSLYGKAYCYFELKDYEASAKDFLEFIRKYPNDRRTLDARLRLADSYYGSKNFAASGKIYKELIHNNRRALDNPYDYYQYAQALFKANDFQDAINAFTNLQTKFPNSDYADKSLYFVGWIYFQQGNYNSAIEGYKNVLIKYPNSSIGALIYYSIGDCYYNLGNYDSAVVNYNQVMIQYPSSNHVYDAVNGIQDSYMAEGHPERAIKFIDGFVNQNPGLSFADQIFFKKGNIYYSIGDYKDASQSYKDFIADYPNSKLVPQAYYWVGKSEENLKQYQDAIFSFNQVFNSYPQSESAAASAIELGNIYNFQKNYNAALNIYDQALAKLPNKLRFPEIMFNKGMTLLSNKDSSDAVNIFNQVIQKYAGTIFSEKSKLEMGLISFNAGQYDVAIPYFQDLAQNRTDAIGAQAQYYYGVVLFNQKDYTDAITALVRVGTIFPAYDEWVAKSYLKLGACYEKLKDKSKAREMYRVVFSKHRGDKYGKEALKKLRSVR